MKEDIDTSEKLLSALINSENELDYFLKLSKSNEFVYSRLEIVIEAKKTMALEKIARIMDKK